MALTWEAEGPVSGTEPKLGLDQYSGPDSEAELSPRSALGQRLGDYYLLVLYIDIGSYISTAEIGLVVYSRPNIAIDYPRKARKTKKAPSSSQS